MIVNVSVFSSVVSVIPVPAAKVSVSLFVAATIEFSPDTAMFLNMLCDEPLSLLENCVPFKPKPAPAEYVVSVV